MKESSEQFNNARERYTIPEDIQRGELEVYDRLPDKEFWTEKNLEYWFARDSAFGAKLSAGLAEILEGVMEEDTPEYEEFSKVCDTMQLQSSTVPEKVRAALWARRWVSKTFHILPEQLTARNIIARAYIGEAAAMYDSGLDPDIDSPFTLSAGLKAGKKRKDIEEILRKGQGERGVEAGPYSKDGTVEITDEISQSEIVKLANEFNQSPELFRGRLQWLDDVAETIGQKKYSAEIIEMLRYIGQAERVSSVDKRDVIAKQILCIRQMKRNLRDYGVVDDALSDEAFQKWLKSKKSRR